MTDLEYVRRRAQEDADQCDRPFAILNLRPFAPLYVVREVPRDPLPGGELVEIIEPRRKR